MRAHEDARIDELLDVIALLLTFSRAGTFDEDPGELEAWREAREVLGRYRPDAVSTSSMRAGSELCIRSSVARTDT
jgi:hypothetical protein